MLRRGLHMGALALTAGLGLASAAHAKPFFLMPTTSTSWLVVDPASVESRPGAVVRRLWTVSVMRSIVTGDPPQPGYVRTHNDYDCDSGQTRWLTFQVYSRSGDMILTRDNPSPTWNPANTAPDILAAYRIACQGSVNGLVSAESIGRLVITLMATWDPPIVAAQQAAAATPAAKGPTAKSVSAAILPKPGPAKPAPATAKPPATPAAKAAAAPPRKST